MMKYGYLFFLGFLFLITSCNRDACKEVSCMNGGFCNQGECLCPAGFEGEECEKWLLQRFLGTYLPTYDCVNTELAVVIEQKPNHFDKLNITNLGDYACNEIIRLEARVQGDSIFIPLQKACAEGSIPNGYDFAGKGKMKGDTIWLDFQANYANFIDFCKVKMVRSR
ncbi:MAG: hypothetical protein ACKVTZ_11765 [Bacteroidia bacterium]